jgi:hypothetical protein
VGEAKGRNMVVAGDSFVTHDLENYIIEEKTYMF